MSTRRQALAAILLGLVAVAGVAAVSALVLELARERDETARQSAVEENVRLALWRMDTALAAFLAWENARPVADYRRWPQGPDTAENVPPEVVALHFELDERGAVRLPYPPSERNRTARWNLLAADLPPATRELRLARPSPPPAPALKKREKAKVAPTKRKEESVSMRKASNEYAARSRAIQDSIASSNAAALQAQRVEPPAPVSRPVPRPAEAVVVAPTVLAPVWVQDELVLVREARDAKARPVRQGLWLDRRAVESWLAGLVGDLLPEASFLPSEGDAAPTTRLLASLPLTLVPGALPAFDEPPELTVWPVLVATWSGLLLAAIGVIVVLVGTTRLSERRAAFVSSVTHELRTPLTTFRMYTEMLAADMVPDPAKRRTYLETLQREAARLSHLVENVLSFSRVEQGRRPPAPLPTPLAPLLERLVPRLEERAAQAGLELVVEGTTDATVLADPGGLEQILFNLVDNAAKYAAKAVDRRLHLSVETGHRTVILRVRDHGPGIDPVARRDLFVPFAKSAARAAESAPGVGLGLALSRRLARSMHGDLRHERPDEGGASFAVTLVRSAA